MDPALTPIELQPDIISALRPDGRCRLPPVPADLLNRFSRREGPALLDHRSQLGRLYDLPRRVREGGKLCYIGRIVLHDDRSTEVRCKFLQAIH
jgi:hypothetical protein